MIQSGVVQREEAVRLAERVLDYHATSYVEAARALAIYVKAEDERANAALSQAARLAELEEQNRILRECIEDIAAAEPDDRDQKIAAAVTAKRSCQ